MIATPGADAPAPRFLVTGGTGFIGRRLVQSLVSTFGAGSVVCLTKAAVTPGEAEGLARFERTGVATILGDLLDNPVAGIPAPKVDVVFHLAANIDTNATEAELRVNDLGTTRLLEWLAPAARGTRIVYTSSVAVHDRIAEPSGPINEMSPFVPRTPYGMTKLKGEMILRERAAHDGFSFTIVRLPTIYGPGQKPGGLFDKLMTLASSGALAGRIDWPGRTSILYVDDVVRVMIDLAGRADTAGETYCLASDESMTVGELARRVAAFEGSPVTPIGIPPPLLALIRRVAWSQAAFRVMPRIARVSFWRLSLIVSDGFWFDTRKFRAAYKGPLKALEEALDEMRAEQARSANETGAG